MKTTTMLYKVGKIYNNFSFLHSPKSRYKLLLVLSFSSLFFTNSFGANKTFIAAGNFSDPTKWTGLTLPVAGDNLTINNTCTIDNNVLTDNIAYGTLVIGGGGAYTLSWIAGGTNRLNVTDVSSSFAGSNLNMTNGGTLIVNGTWTTTNLAFTPGTGTIDIRSTITLPAAYTTYNNLIINGAATTVSVGVGTTINGTLTITSGTFTIDAFSLAIAGATTVTSNLTITSNVGVKSFGNVIINGVFTIGSASINVTGNWTNNGTFNHGTSDVYFKGTTSQTLNGNFYDLRINNGAGGSCTLAGNVILYNSLYLTTGILNAGSYTVTISNDILTSGSNLNAQTSTFIFNGTVGQTIASGTTFNNVIVNGVGSIVKPQGNIAINGNLTITVGIFDQTNAARVITGNGASNTLLVQAGGTLEIRSAGTTPFASAFSGWESLILDPASTVEWIGAAVRTWDLNSMYNVIISAGTNTLGANTTITGDLIIVGGADLNTSASNFSLTITGNLTLGANALTANASTISIGGNFTGTGTITAGTSTFIFNGIGSQTFSSTTQVGNYYNIIINKASGVASPVGNVTLLSDLTISSGTLDMITFTADRSVAGGTLTISNGATLRIKAANFFPVNYSTHVLGTTSTIEYYGAAQTVSNEQYGHLTLSGTGTKTLPASAMIIAGNFTLSGTAAITALNSITIGGDLILNTGSKFTAGAFTHNVGGNWTNNGGTFTQGTGTIVFNGTGAQSINGTAASQIFNNIIVSKSAGTLMNVTGNTTTLKTNDFTETSGNFTAPATMNIIATATSSLTLNGGIYTAGTSTNVTGNWTNNGGTFTPGLNTVVFNGNGSQTINGTATSQTFYNLTIAKTAGTLLNTGGSTTTLTINDFTETTGDFTASANFNITGNRTLTAGVFTAGAITNVTGNWTGNGGTFNAGTSTVNFIGTGTKTLGGSSVTSFYNLTLNTSAATDIVQLTNNAIVTSVLNLTKGVLDLNSKSLSVTSGLAGAITRTSGYILSEKMDNSSKIIWSIGNNLTSHTYPFGTASGSYIPFILNLTAGDIGNATISTYHTATDNTPYPASPIAVNNMYSSTGSDNSANVVDRFWQIDKDGPSGTATITFTATSAEVGSIMIPTAQRYETLTDKWQLPLPGQTSTATSATVPGVTTFSPWTLSSQAIMLPIELVSFDAVYTNPFVSFTWVTESENNSDYYTIERTTDESTFETVCEVKAAGHSTQTMNYQTSDMHPSSGESYYRLKQVDLDGTASYSDLVAIKIMVTADEVHISPNPASGFINVKMESQVDTSTIQIISMTGQVVLQKNINKENGNYNQELDINDLKPGLYYVDIESGNNVERGKFLKK